MKDGDQTFTPDLTFHGYRYLEITGLDEALPAENLKSLVLSSIDNTATYDSSNELVNRLFLNTAVQSPIPSSFSVACLFTLQAACAVSVCFELQF